ncbi:hypothetical protein H0H92_013989, partial [Tricholoma furcatifolium]
MSDDLLTLVTPPASPTLRIDWQDYGTMANADIVDLPDADTVDSLQVSPIKREHAYSSYRQTKGPTKRSRLNSNRTTVPREQSSVIMPGSTLEVTSRDLSGDVSLGDSTTYNLPASPTPRALVPDWNEDGLETFEALLAPSLLGDVNDTEQYPEFVEAALSACLGFYRLTSSIYLVQGWDTSTATAT